MPRSPDRPGNERLHQRLYLTLTIGLVVTPC